MEEIVPEGMLPEDPLTDFYQQNEESNDMEEVKPEFWEEKQDDEKEEEHIENTDEDNANSSGEIDSLREIPPSNLSDLKSMLVFLALGNRYNLLNCLEQLRPSNIILYNVDLMSTRIIEVYTYFHTNCFSTMFELTKFNSNQVFAND